MIEGGAQTLLMVMSSAGFQALAAARAAAVGFSPPKSPRGSSVGPTSCTITVPGGSLAASAGSAGDVPRLRFQ